MTAVWVVVAVFVVVAIVFGGLQALAALGDRRRAREVANDDERLRPHDGRG